MEDRFRNKYRIQSTRLKNWNYSCNAAYYVTVCTKNRECFFGDIVHGNMNLSEIGELANKYWKEIPEHFPFVFLDTYVIMPNHIHGIIVIDNRNKQNHRDKINVEILHATSLPESHSGNSTVKEIEMSNVSPKPGSLSTIIRSYKSVVTKSARKINSDFIW